MNRIHILSQALANQIAAGEVIERPASVVKEVIENSLDAGATELNIDIEKGGLQLIQIRDNGSGIHRDDLPLALSRHGTSKISDFVDLEKITTLGFRGEALASIAAISRTKLISCMRESTMAFQIQIDGSDINPEIIPVAHPVGTTVSIADLFYNTPARRKFLKSEKTEFDHIEEMIKRLALSRFDLRLTLQHNQKKVFALTQANSEIEVENRLAKVIGKDFIENAIKLETQINQYKIYGWITLGSYQKNNVNKQYFYLNGRIIRDKIIMHAIKQVYEEFFPGIKNPAYVLYLEVDASEVDVNVHPTKHEVRFRQARFIHDFIYKALHEALSTQRNPADKKSFYGQKQQENIFEYSLQKRFYESDSSLLSQDQVLINENNNEYLGNALALIDNKIILSQYQNEILIVHLTQAFKYYYLKIWQQNFIKKPLLFPISLTLTQQQILMIEDQLDYFSEMGWDISVIQKDKIMIRQMPQDFPQIDMEKYWQTVFISWQKQSTSENLLSLQIQTAVSLISLKNEISGLNFWLRKFESHFNMDELIHKKIFCKIPTEKLLQEF